MTALPVDGRVWHVRDYPNGETVLHTAATYEEADQWREDNGCRGVILPEWPSDPAPPPPAPGRNGRWEKLGQVGVDSASIGITDLLCGETGSQMQGAGPDSRYAVPGSKFAGDWGTGIRFWAGFGDGGYDVWAWIADYSETDDGESDERVAQIVVTMIDQQELAQWRSDY